MIIQNALVLSALVDLAVLQIWVNQSMPYIFCYTRYYKFRHSGDYPLNYDENSRVKLLVIIWWNTVFYCTILELGNLTITNDVVHFLSAQKILLHHMFEWLNLLTKYVQKFCRLKRSIWSMGRVFKPANDLYPEFTKNSNSFL